MLWSQRFKDDPKSWKQAGKQASRQAGKQASKPGGVQGRQLTFRPERAASPLPGLAFALKMPEIHA
jgi:hypothetical protein